MVTVWFRAIDFLNANKKEFKLPLGPLSDETLQRLKPLGELALVSSLLLHRKDVAEPQRKYCRNFLTFAWSELRRGEVFVEVLEARPDLVILGSIYPCFEEHGYRNDRAKQLFELLVASRSISSIEFPAWRGLDLAYACDRMGIRSRWNLGDIFPSTWLARHPEPWLFGEETAYAVTHTVFYMTAFGLKPTGLGSKTTRYLKTWGPVWLAYFYEIKNFDLFAEIALSLECIGERNPSIEGRLRAVQRADGSIPGPAGSAKYILQKGQSQKRQRFLRNYHTTLVSLLASFASRHGLAKSLLNERRA